jgi:hypothetical protein
VEPYVHGWAADEREVVLCYQTTGESKSGRREGWKTLDVAKIEGMVATGVFVLRPRDDYAGYGRGIATVHCRVDL